jgi:hypothetical protein
MRKRTPFVAVALLVIAVSIGTVRLTGPTPTSAQAADVTICYNGTSIVVAASAVAGYVQLGATVGACGSATSTPTVTVTATVTTTGTPTATATATTTATTTATVTRTATASPTPATPTTTATVAATPTRTAVATPTITATAGTGAVVRPPSTGMGASESGESPLGMMVLGVAMLLIPMAARRVTRQ